MSTTENTDITLLTTWDGCRVFAAQGRGGIGIDVGGHCIVKPVQEWHALAAAAPPAPEAGEPIGEVVGVHRVAFATLATVAWTKAMPSVGTKLYAAPLAQRDAEGDAERLVADAIYIIQDYANHNPCWTDSRGGTQDPCGAHAWLVKARALSAAKEGQGPPAALAAQEGKTE